MDNFHISRIHTSRGILRLSGLWQHEQENVDKDDVHLIEIKQLEMMGTDGWVSLSLAETSVLTLIDEIRPEVIEHLASRAG